MKVVLTGAGGFLGSHVARALLEKGTLTDSAGCVLPLQELVAVDLHPITQAWSADPRVKQVTGDITDPAILAAAITPDCVSIFHFAAMLKADASKDFAAAMNFNVRATIDLLERCREIGTRPKFFFASSIGVYGDGHTQVDNLTRHAPVSSYGSHKAIGELLVDDYSRADAVDGRGLRFPMVLVRPGRNSTAVSGIMSGIIREPMLGADFTIPFASDLRMPVTSAHNAAQVSVQVNDMAADRFTEGRTFNMPSLNLSVADLADAVSTRAPHESKVGTLSWRMDSAIAGIFNGRPEAIDNRWALDNGLMPDANAATIVDHFIDDLGH
ncbi:MAG: NAD-dependent epimerase/dehydratase family protein [Rhizobiaceae bacterium]|nr:NAD-dependent epimerase/dehydratase family protein [Rhizobiaceae bacterium]